MTRQIDLASIFSNLGTNLTLLKLLKNSNFHFFSLSRKNPKNHNFSLNCALFPFFEAMQRASAEWPKSMKKGKNQTVHGRRLSESSSFLRKSWKILPKKWQRVTKKQNGPLFRLWCGKGYFWENASNKGN